MTDSDFFKQDQEQWFHEFVETQLPQNFQHTNTHPEKFILEDVPF